MNRKITGNKYRYSEEKLILLYLKIVINVFEKKKAKTEKDR